MAVSPNSPLPLRGQRALVTGASSGIGRACALALAKAGAYVVVNYVGGKDAAETVVADIVAAGGRAHTEQADVSSEEEVRALFARSIERCGSLDILIANAGIQQDAPIAEMTLEKWSKVIAVNLTGQMLCAREAIREFRRRGVVPELSRAAGKIICMSSVHQIIPWAGHVNYAASKGGVDLMMRSLAQEVAPDRIRVNAVAPGAIRTRINKPAWSTDEALRQLLQLIPYGRIGEAEDVAEAVVWLAGDSSDYVVGTTLLVDGGMTLYPGFAKGG